MPVELTEPITSPAPESPPRKRWTRAEFKLLDSAGLDSSGLELIDGELIDKRMGKNRPHITALLYIHEWLVTVFGFRRVLKEEPIDVSDEDSILSEPEPDLVVLHQNAERFNKTNPGPADIALLIEVADSSLPFDLAKKALLYARAPISEYWVLDINARRLIVHRKPLGDKYQSVQVYGEQESLSPLAAPGSIFRVALALSGLSADDKPNGSP